MKHLSQMVLLILLSIMLLSCQKSMENAKIPKPIMFFSLVSDPMIDPHSMTMGLQLANHSLEDGRTVVLFFNVKGVTVPTMNFDENISFHAQPIKQLLTDLIAKGAQVHVCPHCMEAMSIKSEDLLAEAKVTTREGLFSFLNDQTIVFTY